jgi:hypothetical protein
MFDQIFGNYLVQEGRITKEQLAEVIEYESSVRVKLGLIAVAEKLMTKEQADEVNQLQAIMDRRFGDIAVEKGYLTEEQVGQLLKKQGNIYMLFVQTLIDKNCMTLEEVDEALNDYQREQGFTHSDMDDLVSGDIERTVKLFLPANTELYDRLCGIAVRTLLRVINSGAYVSKAYLVDELAADKFAMQAIVGDHKIISGFAGSGDSLLAIAEPFAQESFESVDMDALDAVGEFTNCINGLFATDLSGEGIDIDMVPPEFYENTVVLRGNQFCVFPMIIGDDVVNFILSVDSDITIQ